MSIKKTIEIDVSANSAEKELDQISSKLNKLDKGNTKVTKSTKLLGDANKSTAKAVTENGGAVALLDSVTGGMASKFRDAMEATKLFNISLKGMRTALIATGIGALVVAVGLLIAYWDDIVELIKGANNNLENQKTLIESNITSLKIEYNLAVEKGKVNDLLGISNDKILEVKKKIIKAEEDESERLLTTLELQLKKEESAARELSYWQRIKGEYVYEGDKKVGIIDDEELEKIQEIKDKINETKIELLKLKETSLLLDKEEKDAADESYKKWKRLEDEKKKKEESTQKEIDDKKKQDDEKEELRIKSLKEKLLNIEKEYNMKLEDLRDVTNIEKINRQEERDLLELENIKLNEEEKEKAKLAIQDYYRELRKNNDIKEREEKLNKASEDFLSDIENDYLEYDVKLQLIKDREDEITDLTKYNEEERTRIKKENAEAQKKIDDAKYKQQMVTLGVYGDALSNFSDLAGENTVVGKGLAIAGATIDTYASAVAAYKSTVEIPIVGPALAPVAAASAVAAGLATIKNIASVKIPGKSGGNSSTPSASNEYQADPMASFNVVGSSPENQLAESISGYSSEPVQAYVVSGDVTTAQSLDRNRLNNATFL